MLSSIISSRLEWKDTDEILCSWNGSRDDIEKIDVPQHNHFPKFEIAQYVPYHFASNINYLAKHAKGDILVIINDDVVLDPNSLDKAINILNTNSSVGIVGARLRNSDGILSHAGLLFSNNGIPYNRLRPDQLGSLVDINQLEAQRSGYIPAVTGALMVMRRQDFLNVGFRNNFVVCGEDIALCLDMWEKYNLHTYYASEVTAIHNEKSTRRNDYEHNDINFLAEIVRSLIKRRKDFNNVLVEWVVEEEEVMFKLAIRLKHLLKDYHALDRKLLKTQSNQEDLEQRLVAAQSNKVELEQKLVAAQSHQVELEQKLGESEENNFQLSSTISAMKNELELQKNNLSISEQKVFDIQKSKSWLITKPFRLILKILKFDLTANLFDTANKLFFSKLILDSRQVNIPEDDKLEKVDINPCRVNVIDDLVDIDFINQNNENKLPTQLNIIFDVLVLGHAHKSPVSRGGIYRYASQLLLAIQSRLDVKSIPFIADSKYTNDATNELSELIRANDIQTQSNEILDSLSSKINIKKLSRGNQFTGISRSNTIFHTPFQAVPSSVRDNRINPSIITLHDMIPFILPQLFPDETLRNFNQLLEQLREEDHVICVSESTRNDFLRQKTLVKEENVHVTPLAASKYLQPVYDASLKRLFRESIGLQNDDRVILSLCTLEPRKNLINLINVFERIYIRNRNFKLVLAGSLGWKTTALSERIKTSLATSSIIQTGHIEEKHLRTLFSIAEVFVYPSIYEGFGLPPLEAMQCGTPTIAGNTSSLPEVTGDAALLIDPKSTDELYSAISRVLESRSLREKMSSASLKQAALFSWDKTADLTIDIYKRALS